MVDAEVKTELLTTRLCQFLEPAQLNKLLEHCKIVTFKPEEIILNQGQMSDGIYIILTGMALVSAKILGEGVIKLTHLNNGHFIGEISLISQSPSGTSVIAMEEMRCLYINNNIFNLLSSIFPEIKYQIIRAITYEVFDRLKNIQQKITKIIQESNMASLSLFSTAIKSLTKASTINFSETSIDKSLLKELSYFNLFSQDEFDELLKHSDLLKTPDKCVLIHENEKESACYIILQGAVQSSIVVNNKFAKLSVFGPITLFCSISTIDANAPSVINFTTYEQAILLKISFQDLATIREENPQLWYKLFDLLCKSFVALERSANKLDIRLNSELYNR